MKILVVPGDGIGPEITDASLSVLDAAARRAGLALELDTAPCGLASLERYGVTVREEDLAAARAADGVILGPMSVNEYPAEATGGRNVPAAFRTGLDLYANIRPCYTRPGLPATAASMDLVFARENLEDFYTDRNMHRGSGELMPTEDVALAIGKITRQGSERIARAAFDLAQRRERRTVTVIHKAPVLRMYHRLFLDTARAVGAEYPDVTVDDLMIDAAAALLVRTPERFDVILTTNMFGDILSDEAAELAGSLGLAASLNHGDRHAVAQAGHGSAPDIAGRDMANPASLLLSVGLLLDHLGARGGDDAAVQAGALLRGAVDAQLADPKLRTRDLGGSLGTKEFAAHLVERVAA
ncbi:MAG TPA: isocitrate/isopropylmalate family dehydrogenase [Streptosporangiaceae bacterium]|jgi:3-isopropylmalate dehydrogenase|nr:isocitrate/isopropylmalate family dehydrogenase [Streptosporangiaceae bacterium]